MATESGKSPLMSTAEAAELLGVSVSTLHRWRESGRLDPVQKFSAATGAYVFAREDVDRLAASLHAEAVGGDAA